MIDISNKLHVMVDEFVSNLSTKYGSLANNVSGQPHLYVPPDSAPEAAKATRPSNRTTTEVLNGLRRPSGSQVMETLDREGSSPMEHPKSNQKQEGNKRIMDGGRLSRQAKDLKNRSASLDPVATKHDGKHVDVGLGKPLQRNVAKQARGTHDVASKGKFVQHVELLSSDHSSDVSARPSTKLSQKCGENKMARRYGPQMQEVGHRGWTYRAHQPLMGGHNLWTTAMRRMPLASAPKIPMQQPPAQS